MFTPTQKRMMDVLADGLLHKREEMHQCLGDELGAVSNIYAHLSLLRKKLRPKGYDVMSVGENGQLYYRLVRLLASPYKG